jgi:hypothetical protein
MLNIKDPKTHELARELAAIEGTTLTAAVTRALEDALAEHGRKRVAKRQLLHALIRSARDEKTQPVGDAFDELYDPDTGLPR